MTKEKIVNFSAYKIPIGTEFALGKRTWRLIDRMEFHPDFMTFREVSPSPHTPDRVYNPSEIDAMQEMGVAFYPPDQGCQHPPAGWYCTREKGHDGPCAALPR